MIATLFVIALMAPLNVEQLLCHQCPGASRQTSNDCGFESPPCRVRNVSTEFRPGPNVFETQPPFPREGQIVIRVRIGSQESTEVPFGLQSRTLESGCGRFEDGEGSIGAILFSLSHELSFQPAVEEKPSFLTWLPFEAAASVFNDNVLLFQPKQPMAVTITGIEWQYDGQTLPGGQLQLPAAMTLVSEIIGPPAVTDIEDRTQMFSFYMSVWK